MSTLLVLGTGPLIEEAGARVVSGQCLRTMHFVRPLLEAGHDVKLATVPIAGSGDAGRDEEAETRVADGTFRYRAFTTHDENVLIKRLRGVLERGNFAGAVGINAYPAYLLARAAPRIPFWADLNGWSMAEGQTRAALVGHDRDLDHFWRLEVATLLAADRLSTVSERQSDALYGELALVGRLNRRTFSWPFASTVPNAIYATYDALKRGTGALPEALRGKLAPDATIVLWSGGFNTWTDVDLLAAALGDALARVPSMHFVATGGAVIGHDDRTFARFQALARANLPADRVHLLGWVPTEEVLALHALAHVGISIDSRNTETRFGARNRLTNMLGAGLPVLTTSGTEIAAWIERHRAGSVVAPGDAGAFAHELCDAAERRDFWERRARRARQRAREDFRPGATLAEFLAWADAPTYAPDRDPVSLRGRSIDQPTALETWNWARLKVDGQVGPLLIDRASLANLRAKLPLRLWRHLRSLLRRSR